MSKWKFTFDGIDGIAEAYSAGAYAAGVFVLWGGMGFHLDAASSELRDAILEARQ